MAKWYKFAEYLAVAILAFILKFIEVEIFLGSFILFGCWADTVD